MNTKAVGNDELHYLLGLVLEERNLASASFPKNDINKKNEPNENQVANDSFMADEIDGLLMQIAIPPTATDIAKLKALNSKWSVK